jgi:hypothetical protein
MPEKLKNLYASLHDNSEEGKIKSSEVLNSIDYDDEIKIFPEYYGRVLKLLSDIPQDIIDLMDAVERKTLFDICHHVICLSSISGTPLFKNDEGKIEVYTPSEDESFSFLGDNYFYPKSLKLAGLSSPMENEPIITFTEASDVLSNWHQAGKGNANISMIAAIYCRKKGEVYSESIVKERSGAFENLPMSVIWRLFFLHYQVNAEIKNRYPHLFTGNNGASETDALSTSRLDTFGSWGLLFEIAKEGIFGTIEQTKLVGIYEFYHYVGYKRAHEKYQRLIQGLK